MRAFLLAVAAMVCGAIAILRKSRSSSALRAAKSAGFLSCLVALTAACALQAQMGRTYDWWTYAGDAQRTGWEKNDAKFVKEDVKSFQQLWKIKVDAPGKGPRRLAAPVVLGNLIGSRGFKELAFVQSGTGDVWSIDADLARMYWDKHLPAAEKSACPALATAPGLPPPVVFRFGAPRPPAAAPPPPTAPSGAPSGQGIPGGGPAAPAAGPPAGAPPAPAIPPAMNAMFRVRPFYMLTPDGKLRQLNVDDAAELKPGIAFLPQGLHASSLNMAETTMYAVGQSCGKAGGDAVYALDLSVPEPKPVEFKSTAPLQGAGGAALSTNGTVYVQTGDGQGDPTKNSYANAVLALSAKELQVKDYVTLPAGGAKAETGMNSTTPVLFTFKGRELVVTAGKDGRLYLLDASSLGGSDHKTPLSRTEPLSKPEDKNADKGIWTRLASWEAPDTTRYVIATVWGGLESGMPAPSGGSKAENGSLVAFKIAEDTGQLKLLPVWTSRNLQAPDAPVIAQGVVFVLENGKYKRKVKGGAGMAEESPAGATHATLYALDGVTGQELWSSGEQVKAAGSLTGLSIANSRVYFTTVDNMVYAFGKYLETEQH